MDQDPQDNRSSTNNTYQPQYHWLSPLRDIQTGIFNPETGLNLEDNPISGIDPELFTKRATNTSARTGTSTHSGYQTHYHWLNPPRNIQPGIFNPEPAPNQEDNPISGVDPALFTKRATYSSARAGQSTHLGYQHQDIQTKNQSFSWPTTFDNEHEPIIKQNLVRHRHTLASLSGAKLAEHEGKHEATFHNILVP